ncbi:Hypothetical predicted protein [Cloeon dipterum]|uniref:Uncharacterized protein n=1 Tax=Cloeon dipterum TaxID=197152 RepID=A0A8S1DY63_9INSE|nr:Hypothetical predicted protein [Cloeon dipterum]
MRTRTDELVEPPNDEPDTFTVARILTRSFARWLHRTAPPLSADHSGHVGAVTASRRSVGMAAFLATGIAWPKFVVKPIATAQQ